VDQADEPAHRIVFVDRLCHQLGARGVTVPRLRFHAAVPVICLVDAENLAVLRQHPAQKLARRIVNRTLHAPEGIDDQVAVPVLVVAKRQLDAEGLDDMDKLPGAVVGVKVAQLVDAIVHGRGLQEAVRAVRPSESLHHIIFVGWPVVPGFSLQAPFFVILEGPEQAVAIQD